jgi:hypothetical protein
MNNNFNFNRDDIKYSVKPPENTGIPKTEGLGVTEGVIGQVETPLDLRAILTNDELFSKFRSEIVDNPRSFNSEEIDLILKYSQMKGKHLISIIFEQSKDSSIHIEYIDHIIDCLIDKEQCDVILNKIEYNNIKLTPEQQTKFKERALKVFNVATIINHLETLQLSQEQKNSILDKHISTVDLRTIIQNLNNLNFDSIIVSKLVDKAVTNKDYKTVLENLDILRPNAKQLNLLVDKIEPRFWGDWKLIDHIAYYDTSILDMPKFEESVLEAKCLQHYFQNQVKFNLTIEHMYELCLISAEKVKDSGGTYILDQNAIGYLITKASKNELSLPIEKIKELVRVQLDNGGDLDVFCVYEYAFKLDASFIKDIGASAYFSQNALRTKFDLTPDELKNHFDQKCRYEDSKYLNGINMVLNSGTTGQKASETIYTQLNNEFIIMNEANRRNGGKLDPKMTRISQAFGGTTDIEGYLLGRIIYDGIDEEALANLKTVGLTETGEAGLDQLQEIFGEFKTQLLKPEMTISELKSIREKLDIPLFQHYFVNFTRQTQGQFGNKTVESLLNQMDYLIEYHEKTGVSDLEIVGQLKEGYESQDMRINVKAEQEFPLNPEVSRQLDEYKTNMESAMKLFEGSNGEKSTYRLFGFVKAGKQLIGNLCSEAQKELDEFDPEKILAANDERVAQAEAIGDTKKVKINDPAKMLIGLEQKVKRMSELRTMVSAKTESGREYVSPKIILDNWVVIFSELAKYKDNPEVKNYLQQMLFAEYINSKDEASWLGTELESVNENIINIKNIDPENPNISTLEDTLEIVTHLINQEYWKKQVFEQRNRIIETPNTYKQSIPGLPGYNGLNMSHDLNPLNKGLAEKLKELKPDSEDTKATKKFEEKQKLPVSRAMKDLDNILGLSAIKDFVDTANQNQRASGEKVKWNLQPTRSYLLEVSGKLCDACWADKNESINESYPNLTFVNISSQTEDGETKLEGGFMLMEINGQNGEKILTIRGLNPLLASIDNLVAQSLVQNIIAFTKTTADRIGAIPAIVIDDHCGGSCSNRPAIQTYCQNTLAPSLEKLQVINNNRSNFNGYDISGWTYRLDNGSD